MVDARNPRYVSARPDLPPPHGGTVDKIMTHTTSRVVAGVDAHTDEHHVAVLDEQGRLLATTAFPATARGYQQLIDWVERHGAIDRIGVESTGSFAAGLTRALQTQAMRVVEAVELPTHDTSGASGAAGFGWARWLCSSFEGV